MSITYTWKVKQMKVQNSADLEKVVVQTYWEKTGTDEEGDTGTFHGATPFSAANVDPSKFVPFDELSEEDVIGWIQAVVVDNYEEHVNQKIQDEINSKKNPKREEPLPWGNNTTSLV